MKLLFTLVVGTLSFTLNALENPPPQSCHEYAIDACAQESAQYGVMSPREFAEAYTFYYNGCVASGGNPQDPIFID